MSQAATSLRSVALLTLLTLGQMGLQFAFQLVLAKHFGAESEMDEFLAALALPMVVSGLLAGAFASAFVPVYIDTKQQSGETAAWTMAVQMTCWMFLATVLMWQASRLFAEPLMRVLHPHWDDDKLWRTAELFQTLASLMVWNSLGGLARAWNHCHGRFGISGIAAVVGNGVTFVWAWQKANTGGIEDVAQAVCIGAIVSFAVQMPWIQIFSRGWPVTPESQSAVKRCVMMMMPLLFIMACTQFEPLLDQYLVSDFAEGSLSHLGFATRLAAAVLTLSTSGLAVVAFPALARHVANQDSDRLRAEIAAALRFLILLLVPVIVALVMFASPLVRDLLQRGRFRDGDTHAVAALLTMLCGLIVGGSVAEIAAKVFYSWQKTRTLVLVGLCGLALDVVLKLMWYRTHGVSGLASATSVYYLFNALVLLVLITLRLGPSIFQGVPGTLLRVAIGSTAAAVVGMQFLKTSLPLPSVIGAVAGAVTLLIVLVILRDDVVWRAVRMFFPTRPEERQT